MGRRRQRAGYSLPWFPQYFGNEWDCLVPQPDQSAKIFIGGAMSRLHALHSDIVPGGLWWPLLQKGRSYDTRTGFVWLTLALSLYNNSIMKPCLVLLTWSQTSQPLEPWASKFSLILNCHSLVFSYSRVKQPNYYPSPTVSRPTTQQAGTRWDSRNFRASVLLNEEKGHPVCLRML